MPPKVPQAFLDDAQAKAWLAEPMRLDGREILYYLGWSQVGFDSGHAVRRLQDDKSWGPPFIVKRFEMERTTTAGLLAAGVSPPC